MVKRSKKLKWLLKISHFTEITFDTNIIIKTHHHGWTLEKLQKFSDTAMEYQIVGQKRIKSRRIEKW
jgi:hypothetical protein